MHNGQFYPVLLEQNLYYPMDNERIQDTNVFQALVAPPKWIIEGERPEYVDMVSKWAIANHDYIGELLHKQFGFDNIFFHVEFLGYRCAETGELKCHMQVWIHNKRNNK